MKFNRGVVAVNVKVHMGLFDAPLAARLDGIAEADLVGISAPDVHVAYTQTQVYEASGTKIAGVAMRLLVLPIVGRALRSRAEGKQEQARENCFVQRIQVGKKRSGHEAPPGRKSA
jgi:hypothetical protein